MNKENTNNLEDLKNIITKQFGKGSIVSLADKPIYDEDHIIHSGSIGLDIALGIGGYPRGRIVEIYGPESCLAAESYLQYEVWNNGKRINHKGGNIRRLYERFKGERIGDGPNQGHHLQNNTGTFYIKSVGHDDRIIRNEVLDVVHTGKKLCFRIETETGEVLFSTKEHKYMTPNGFLPLSKLIEGDTVFVHNMTRPKGRKHYPQRPEVYVKYHPNLPTKVVHDGKTGNDYLYRRGQRSRIAYEAFLNNKTYEEYVEILNTQDKIYIDTLIFLPPEIHVHHKDEDFNNNKIDNLQLIDPTEHGKLHAMDRIKNLSFVATPSKIKSIQEAGEMDTFDLKCAYPYNNYIAEGIVVHNSGKTTLLLHAIANCQAGGGACAFIDTEHALDVLYAQRLGVDFDNGFLLSQPDTAEEALEIVTILARSGMISLVVVDSVAALVPKDELEGEAGKQLPGLQARLMSQAMRKLAGVVNRSQCTVMFTNQIRNKIGVMFGSPEVTSGGNALKFYASQRIDIRRGAKITGKNEDDILGNETRVKVVKNKMAPPFKQTEFNIIYGQGIDRISEIMDYAVMDGIIQKSGSWFKYKDKNIAQGTSSAAQWLAEQPELATEFEKEILASRGLTQQENKDE